MRAKEFIIEYDRNKTTQMMGRNLANAFVLGGDKRQYEFYNTTFKTPEGQPDLLKIVDHVLKNLEEAAKQQGHTYEKELSEDETKTVEDRKRSLLPTFFPNYSDSPAAKMYSPLLPSLLAGLGGAAAGGASPG